MLEHYSKSISKEEFSERNSELEVLVAKVFSEMNARNVTNSTITLTNLSDLFAAEFTERCDFLMAFTINNANLVPSKGKSDIVTEAKRIFQQNSYSEKNLLSNLYESSTKHILSNLRNKGMAQQIEKSMVDKMERRIRKNNLYVEIEFKKIQQARDENRQIFILQPNFYGLGVRLNELWSRIQKQT